MWFALWRDLSGYQVGNEIRMETSGWLGACRHHPGGQKWRAGLGAVDGQNGQDLTDVGVESRECG